jgi:hypothetical protein
VVAEPIAKATAATAMISAYPIVLSFMGFLPAID